MASVITALSLVTGGQVVLFNPGNASAGTTCMTYGLQTCLQDIHNTVDPIVAGAQQIVNNCRNGAGQCGAIMDAVDAVKAAEQNCINQTPGTLCGDSLRGAQAILQGCVNETQGTVCGDALRLAKDAAQDEVQAALVVVNAVLGLAIATIESCVGGTNNLCNAALEQATQAEQTGFDTDSVQVTYWDEDGNLIGTTPATTTLADSSGVVTDDTVDPMALSGVPTTPNVDTPTVAMASGPACTSGHVCGNPTYQGCAKWKVWRTRYGNFGRMMFRVHVDVYYCWSNKVIERATLDVQKYVTDISDGVQNGGIVSDDEYYYQYWSGIPDSGHASQVQWEMKENCGPWGCPTHRYPWIHEYVHGDGTMYFHTGS